MKVRGIPHSDSARAVTTLMKTDWLMEQNNGRGLIAATGTPISNTLVEMYVIQRFLQMQEMRDKWVQQVRDTHVPIEQERAEVEALEKAYLRDPLNRALISEVGLQRTRIDGKTDTAN